MELTSDLTSLQSIISECQRSVGSLAAIDYKGGNERKIQHVFDKIRQFLISNNYIADPYNPATAKHEELQKVILFLILNTKLSNEAVITSIKEYSHLINIMPKLSKFLLLNTIVDLQIVESLTNSITNLPLGLLHDLFENVNDLFVGVEGSKVLKNVDALVRFLIERVNNTDPQETMVSGHVKKITNIIGQLLMNLSVHPSVNMTESTEADQFLHIGYILRALFKMLLMVNDSNPGCNNIIELLVMNTSMVTKYVTVNVLCEWTEVDVGDDTLQYSVCTTAYYVVEKYMKVAAASGLSATLSCLVRKPLTLSEMINNASVSTIIGKINQAGENQVRWFTALLHTPIFESPPSRECLERWSTLCTVEDVVNLLQLALELDDDAKRLAIRCAAHLSIEDTSQVIAQYFWRSGNTKRYLRSPTVRKTARLLLNKLNHNEATPSTHFIKDLQLLFLESPSELLSMLFQECLKSPLYVCWVQEFFFSVKQVMSISTTTMDIVKTTLEDSDYIKNLDEVKSINALLKALITSECVDINKLYILVLKPFICTFNEYELIKLNVILTVTKELDITNLSHIQTEELLLDVFQLLERHRINYTVFSKDKVGICNSCIDIIKKLDFAHEDSACLQNMRLSEINTYYLMLKSRTPSRSFVLHLFPEFSPNNYGLILSNLIKFLSRCVSQEWVQIAEDMVASLGIHKSVEALTDCLVLICEVTAREAQGNQTVYWSLEYYLNCYGLCIKRLSETNSTIEVGTDVVKNVCRLITILPPNIKRNEGIHLITLLNDDALRLLAKDKKFVSSLPTIDDVTLAQILAKKMLN